MESLLCIHPGEVLLEDFMKPYQLTTYQVSEDIGVSPIIIKQIINGQNPVTADIALRLAKYFGTSGQIWMRLQARYELEVAQQRLGEQIEHEVKVYAPARLMKVAA